MNLEPVQPGDKLLPRLSAQWFNGTLESIRGERQRPKNKKRVRHHNELYCYVNSDVSRYSAAGLISVKEGPSVSRLPIIEGDHEHITPSNWVIPQETKRAGEICLCVVMGITRAFVEINEGLIHSGVTWGDGLDPGLKTAHIGKGTFLGAVTPNDQGWAFGELALINIGVMNRASRVTGLLVSAMPAVSGLYDINTVKGIDGEYQSLLGNLSVHNTHEFEADEGALVRAEWHYENKRWEIYQVTCPE